MKAVSARVPRWFQNLLYITLSLSCVTGIGFYILSRYITVVGDFGPEKHPLQFPVLQLHGAMAFLMMMIIGALLAGHAPIAWRLKRVRNLGLTLVAITLIQVSTAYILYYIAQETLREWIAIGHLGVGIALPLLLLFHIYTARKSRS